MRTPDLCGAIALAVVDEHAFGAVIKFGCRAIASPKNRRDAFFRFSRKAIAFSSHSAQGKAIASPSYFEGFSMLNQLTFLHAYNS
jgi:hypothetical protein